MVDFNVRVRPASRNGTREEVEADAKRYLAEMRLRGFQAFERDRGKARPLGSKLYIWRSCGDGDVCPACAGNNGKQFPWTKAPPSGHPGECETCSVGFCRCYAQAVLPDNF